MALIFSGSSDQVSYGDVNAIDAATRLSWMAWVNPNAATNTPGYTKGTLFLLYATATSRWACGVQGSIEVRSTKVPVAGVWTHVGFTYDGSQSLGSRTRMYFNGVEDTTVGNDFGTSLPSNVSALLAGRDTTVVGPGRMAHARIYSATLTPAQVAQESQSYRPVVTSSLIIWSPFDDGVAARDYSGRGNNGTVTGARQVAGPPISYGG